jgi:hypothetical protein
MPQRRRREADAVAGAIKRSEHAQTRVSTDAKGNAARITRAGLAVLGH